MVFAAGAALIALDGSSVFSRQETLTSTERIEQTGASAKAEGLSRIPTDLIHDPFGLGLGTAGAVSGFGGSEHLEVEGEKAAAGSAYSLLVREVGLPGLVLWVGLSLSVIVLALRRLRRIQTSSCAPISWRCSQASSPSPSRGSPRRRWPSPSARGCGSSRE